MTTQTEALKLALDEIKNQKAELEEVGITDHSLDEIIKALEEALAKQEQGEPKRKWKGQIDNDEFFESLEQEQGEPVAWTETDMAYRPNGLPQEFIHHEVESPDDWSEWVCPKPEQYFLKCCDCGLVHEAQFRVAKYGEGDYCELVEDKDTQAQFRMRRRTTPQQRTWVGLTDEEIEREWQFQHDEEGNPPDHHDFSYAIEAKLKEKNT